VTLQVGPGAPVDAVLRHDPPTPAELERAIDLVELMATSGSLAVRWRNAI
jgi:hypothetical protein